MLQPVESGDLRRNTYNVRIYLDDVANLVAGLSQFGEVEIEASHRGGTRSRVGQVDDLEGRDDIDALEVKLARGVAAQVSIGTLAGVDYYVDRHHHLRTPSATTS
ncbi:hypothetical protein AB0873_31385 [Micromonospora sp. NPDC047707]|uniref:hypothetical protein n=1 Tax=Micromonospora sp. NPDC047707 TaxID=3154498 RepID=UPI003451CAEE